MDGNGVLLFSAKKPQELKQAVKPNWQRPVINFQPSLAGIRPVIILVFQFFFKDVGFILFPKPLC